MSVAAVMSPKTPKSAAVSLADAVAELLVLARNDEGGRCLWCHSAELDVVVDEAVSGEVTVVCHSCGSELTGDVAVVARERVA